ncbi:MAG: CPBP family intramembrane metalloprotease [candidate division Zixibacteria bacterium]|nr:CPBP family intramembrane metalloprotease [candidate division Zixibacteria bacterium]
MSSSIKSQQLFTNVHPENLSGKIIQFPLTRIIIMVLFFMPISVINNLLYEYVLEPSLSGIYFSVVHYAATVISFIVFLIAYRLYTRYIERRKAYEISGKGSLVEFGIGSLISLGMVLLMVGMFVILGYYKAAGFNSWKIIIDSIFLFGMGAFIQELFFRSIVFRLTEEFLGSWIALVIIALIFGIMHLGNKNATLFTSGALMFEDVLLTAAFIFTRRLWLVWGIHASWNFFQAGIFGMPNSGITFKSWITPEIKGPAWLTGGSFGIEASYIIILLTFAIGLFILKLSVNRKQIVLPVWKRKTAELPETVI